jgi:lysophospholipase L1-like esterase
MRFSHVIKSLAVIGFAALAACGGGGGGSSALLPGPGEGGKTPNGGSILSRIVAVGDSLTAGYQADGMLGATNLKNPLNTGLFVPPTQENGWWTLLYEQASGQPLDTIIAEMYDPAKSPLPLIAGPGLDNQVVSSSAAIPFGQFKGPDPCTFDGGFNLAGFRLSPSARVRMNPTATTIRNVGIPGLTLHEAITIHQPPTDTCKPLPGIPGLLSDVVQEESGTYWPVLRNFVSLGGHLTEVNAAASLHPTLATYWLGANDVLKYMGSGGRFVGGNRTPGQTESDVRSAVSTLEGAGARVVVANLPNIVETGYFQMVETPNSAHECRIRSYAYCFLHLVGGLPSNAAEQIGEKYHLNTPGGCVPASTSKPCGYLTLPGALEVVSYYTQYPTAPGYADLDCAEPAPHCKSVPGSGLGMNYITPEFAAKVQGINDAVNEGIDDAATALHVPLVDVAEIFHGLASGNPANPYFHLASSIRPGLCCTLGFIYEPPGTITPNTGGILSFDGIHPSNSGYGLIAYAFIDTINKAYGTHIPQIDLKAVYNGTRCSNKKFCFPDPYAPH